MRLYDSGFFYCFFLVGLNLLCLFLIFDTDCLSGIFGVGFGAYNITRNAVRTFII